MDGDLGADDCGICQWTLAGSMICNGDSCYGCVTIAVDMFVRHRALEYPTVADVC